MERNAQKRTGKFAGFNVLHSVYLHGMEFFHESEWSEFSLSIDLAVISVQVTPLLYTH